MQAFTSIPSPVSISWLIALDNTTLYFQCSPPTTFGFIGLPAAAALNPKITVIFQIDLFHLPSLFPLYSSIWEAMIALNSGAFVAIMRCDAAIDLAQSRRWSSSDDWRRRLSCLTSEQFFASNTIGVDIARFFNFLQILQHRRADNTNYRTSRNVWKIVRARNEREESWALQKEEEKQR